VSAGEAARPGRAPAWWWFASALAVLAAIPFAPALAPFAPACPLRAWTGIPCLTCGGTRAKVALAGGDVFAAFAANPLVTLAAIAFVAGGLAAPLRLATGRGLPAMRSLPRWARVAIALAIAGSWLWVVLSR
jgi:hypothetical protein